MPYAISLIIFLCFSQVHYSQNLLANGSFEEENICTEYKKNCAPEAWICSSLIANYYYDAQSLAYDGSHFIGLVAGNKQAYSIRSFLRGRLLCGLREGHQYRLEFYVRSLHPVMDSIGVYFSATDFLFEKRPYTQLAPVLIYRDSSRLNVEDNSLWRKISFIYTAQGEEIFITIGNFKKLEYSFLLPPENRGNYYLYMDNISLMPVNIHESICNNADSLKSSIYGENERHRLLEQMFSSSKLPLARRFCE